MKAVVWHRPRKVSVDEVPDPRIEQPTDAVIRVTATAICGSDLHLFDHGMTMMMNPGDILGHEPMGVVEEVGAEVQHIRPGDTVVLFDRQVSLRWGQANVRRWTDDLLAVLRDGDPIAAADLVSHEQPLAEAPQWYDAFRTKEPGVLKVVLRP